VLNELGAVPYRALPQSRSCISCSSPFDSLARFFGDKYNATCTYVSSMAQISFALYEAFVSCGSIEAVAARLDLPEVFVAERVEAARLSILLLDAVS
jgi:hypothetical protein